MRGPGQTDGNMASQDGIPIPPKNQSLPKREHMALGGGYNPPYVLEQSKKQLGLRFINFVRQNLHL
jgi:hypothetical protein